MVWGSQGSSKRKTEKEKSRTRSGRDLNARQSSADFSVLTMGGGRFIFLFRKSVGKKSRNIILENESYSKEWSGRERDKGPGTTEDRHVRHLFCNTMQPSFPWHSQRIACPFSTHNTLLPFSFSPPSPLRSGVMVQGRFSGDGHGWHLQSQWNY